MWIIGFADAKVQTLIDCCLISCDTCPTLGKTLQSKQEARTSAVTRRTSAPVPKCEDDWDYRTPFWAPCLYFFGLHCLGMGFWGIAESEIKDLMRRCSLSSGTC
mmetsp:Transcript_21561/g.49006  ORF Transcript_21561/g.49006 Transcript_21561/m.49006 type:complete len:104 (-) Transcript_21561:213-524(-)